MTDDPYAQYLTPPSATPMTGGGDDPYAKYLAPPGASTSAPAQAKSSAIGGISDPTTWALAGLDHLGMGLGTKNPFMAHAESNSSRMSRNRTRISGCSIIRSPRRLMRWGRARFSGRLARRSVVPGLAAWRRKARLPVGRAAPFRSGPISAALQGAHSPVARLAQGAASLLRGRQRRAAEGFRQARDGRSRRGDRLDGQGQRRRLCGLTSKTGRPAGDHRRAQGRADRVGSECGHRHVAGIEEHDSRHRPDSAEPTQANMGQVNSWVRQINAAAQRERYPTDQVVAGKLDGALTGVISRVAQAI